MLFEGFIENKSEEDDDEDSDVQREWAEAADCAVRLSPEIAQFVGRRYHLLSGNQTEKAGIDRRFGNGGRVRVLLLLHSDLRKRPDWIFR